MQRQITGATLLEQDAHLFAAAQASRPDFTREEFDAWLSSARRGNLEGRRQLDEILNSMMPEVSRVFGAKQDEVVRG